MEGGNVVTLTGVDLLPIEKLQLCKDFQNGTNLVEQRLSAKLQMPFLLLLLRYRGVYLI
jgi:hypothetical protein